MDPSLSNEAVENLVTQFSSALDFYRELVQNSIDAGSSTIDVWMEYQPGTDDEGVISIHVDDYGEGMNEEIIDSQLTRLFASSKENDLTKIGKFGIGFVSVFALKPKGVLVHTGREGEYWEVFFHEDRSFTKTPIEMPVEGTQLTLFVAGDRARYQDLVEGSITTLKRWCSHSNTEVSFEDRSPPDGVPRGPQSINAQFVAAGDCRVEVDQPGTALALAYHPEPTYGFYNQGLALAVTRAGDDVLAGRTQRFRQVAFKIKSRYLEHTLSRETVMRDDNYEKAMAILERAADGPLRAALVQALRDEAAAPSWDVSRATRYHRLLGFLASEPRGTALLLAGHPILRTVAGAARSFDAVGDAVRRDGRVFVAASATRLTALLEAQGVPVFLASTGHTEEGLSPMGQLLVGYIAARSGRSVVEWVRGRLGADHYAEAIARVVQPQDVMIAVAPDDVPPREVAALLNRAQRLLGRIGAGYRELVSGTIESRPDDPQLFVLGRTIASAMALPPNGVYARGFMERPRALVDRRHPHLRALLQLQQRSPAMAAYCLAKALLLEEDRMLERDLPLIDAATEAAPGRV